MCVWLTVTGSSYFLIHSIEWAEVMVKRYFFTVSWVAVKCEPHSSITHVRFKYFQSCHDDGVVSRIARWPTVSYVDCVFRHQHGAILELSRDDARSSAA